MLRSWQGCFFLTALVFALQHLPYVAPFTAFFLMVLLTPWWSVVLINLGFALIVRDVLNATQPRWLLALPGIWFGGYLGLATISHNQKANFDAKIEAANKNKRVQWDKEKQSVLVSSGELSGNNLGTSINHWDMLFVGLKRSGLTETGPLQLAFAV